LVINQQAAELLGHPSVGTELTIHLHGQPLRGRLVGIIEELEKPKIYLDRDDYDRAANPEHFVNSIMFVAEHKDSASVMALKRKVESAVAKSDLDVLYVMSQAERVKILVDHLDIVLTVLVGLSFVVLAVSAFGMASATGIKMRERTRELGVLRAIGATPAVIMRLVTLEGMVVGGISTLLGLVLAQPLSREAAVSFGRLMLGEEASLRYAFSASGLLIVVAVTLAFSLLASWIPAHGALRVAPRDALMFA
jgi:ABC-type antimicrobial peptide transport system permease subunit